MPNLLSGFNSTRSNISKEWHKPKPSLVGGLHLPWRQRMMPVQHPHVAGWPSDALTTARIIGWVSKLLNGRCVCRSITIAVSAKFYPPKITGGDYEGAKSGGKSSQTPHQWPCITDSAHHLHKNLQLQALGLYSDKHQGYLTACFVTLSYQSQKDIMFHLLEGYRV